MPTKKVTTVKETTVEELPTSLPENTAPGTYQTAEPGSEGENDDYEVVWINYRNPSDKINGIYAGQELWLTAELNDDRKRDDYSYTWSINRGDFRGTKTQINDDTNWLETVDDLQTVCILTNAVQSAELQVLLTAKNKATGEVFKCSENLDVRKPNEGELKGNFDQKLDEVSESIRSSSIVNTTVPVSLQRTAITPTNDIGLWVVIRKSTQAISFKNYARFMDMVLCGKDADDNGIEVPENVENVYSTLRSVRSLPFNDTDAYRLLKTATEAFLMVNGGVQINPFPFDPADINDLIVRMGSNSQFTTSGLNNLWRQYIGAVNGNPNPMIPYLELIRQKFGNEPLKSQIFLYEPTQDGGFADSPERCVGVLRNKLTRPFLLELIWSYWHEEGMLVQSINAITRRFQNVRRPNGSRDPLANLEIDPLRPLNNLLWGYVQDEQHRLGIVRRVYEYDHHYGIALQGKAVPKLHAADSRSKFIEAFHHLLYLSSIFFKQDDDTTINSDGFPILNALREVHLILSQGAHNQFGDLPSTARQEMLLQQWLLARPEFREFLPTRNMVAYPEPWMDRVDAMKSLQGWTDTSIDHFNRLGVFGEQILLSVRFGAWSDITQSAPAAANWARFWRAEIQGYIHDYRAVTGVDLSSSSKVDSIPPSVHLFNRYMAQARRM